MNVGTITQFGRRYMTHRDLVQSILSVPLRVAVLLTLVAVAVVGCNEKTSQPEPQRKSDIFGLEPAMTFADAEALIRKNAYTCRTTNDQVFSECIIKETKVFIYYSKHLDAKPITMIIADIPTKNIREVATSIAEQYGVRLGEPDSKGGYNWIIGKGNELFFGGNLVLTNPELSKKDDAAASSRVPKL